MRLRSKEKQVVRQYIEELCTEVELALESQCLDGQVSEEGAKNQASPIAKEAVILTAEAHQWTPVAL